MKNDVFKTRCPNCLAEYELNVSLKGRKAMCQKCRQTFVLNETLDASAALLRPSGRDDGAATSSAADSLQEAFAPEVDSNVFSSNLAGGNDGSVGGDGESDRSDSFRSFGEDDRRESTDSSVGDASTSNLLPPEFANEKFPDPPPGVWRAGEKLLGGAYQVLPLAPGKLYAEGGVGVVQRVRRRDWNVDLVVKSPKPGVATTEAGKESFERECQTWIELGLHANIVSCYFVRRVDGNPCLFAEYAPDGTLRDWIVDGRLYVGTPKEALARILDAAIQFAWGLEHAHRQGLLHLDVKPSNVMTSGTTIKVTDFGLSKIARPTTADGDVSTDSCEGMTPSYCSPEQYEAFKNYQRARRAAKKNVADEAAGGDDESASDAPTKSTPIARQSDIWSWAISIFAMFHGRSPCKMGGQTAAEAFEVFLQAPPSDQRPTPPASLVELLRRCFRKNPAERPESMQVVADRLVEIYEKEIGEKYPRRQPQNAALTAESFSNRAISMLDLDKTDEALELLRQAIAVDPFNPQIAFNRTLALWRVGKICDVQAVDRLVELTKNRAQDATAFYALGLVQFERCNLKAALDAFGRALELAPKRDDVRQAIERAEALLPIEAQCLERRVLSRDDAARTPALFVDETGEFLLVELAGGRLAVLKAKNGKQQSTFAKIDANAAAENVYPRALAVADDYRWKLFATGPRSAAIAPASQPEDRLGTGKRELRFREVDWSAFRPTEVRLDAVSNGARAADAAESKNCARLLFVPSANEIDVVDPNSNVSLVKLPANGQTLTAFAVSQDGRWAATGGDDGKIAIWDVEHGRCVRTFGGLAGSVDALWFDPRARFVLSLVKGTAFQYWRVDVLCRRSSKLRAPHLLCLINSSEELGERQTLFAELLSQARTADASGDVGKIVDLYRQARQNDGWEATRPDFERLLDRRARRTRLDDAVQTFRFYGHDGPISTLAASWNGSFVVSAGKDCAIRLWGRPAEVAPTNGFESANARFAPQNLADASNDWKNLLDLDGHSDWIRSIAISPNDRFLVSGAWDQNVYLWDLATGRRLRALSERVKNVSQVAFAPDGRTIAVASELGVASLWDGATGELIFRLQVGSGAVRALCFTRDGRYFAAACDDKTVRFWNGRDETPTREIADFPAPIRSIDLSCDGRLLVAGCENGKIYLVDPLDPAGKTRRVLPGHLGGVQHVKLFLDSAWIVSTGKDKTARIWNANDGTEAKKIEGSDGAIASTAFDFAGTTMFVGAESGILKRWNFSWDYEFPGPTRSRAEISRTIGVLAAYYAIGAAFAKRKIPPTAYYGKNATAVVRNFSDEFPFDDEVWRRVCAEASCRGFGAIDRETIRKIALEKWRVKAPIFER